MSVLRRARAELTGAWRSVRYDMGRRPVEPPAGGPDMTSTGMNTFGGFVPAEEPSAVVPAPRRPGRAVAVSALGVLTVVGAAGAYLGVVNGLGSLLNETPAAAGTFPPQPAITATGTPNAGIGGGPLTGEPPTTAAGAVAVPGAPVVVTTDPVTIPSRNVSPLRTAVPTSPECACGVPPVPTPTAPASSPSPTASAQPSDSPSPSESSGSPAPSETSATPSDSAEPSESPQAGHRRRHH